MDTYTSGIINQRTSAVRPAISTTSPVPTDTSCDGPSFSLSLSAIPFVNSAISPNNNTASAGIKYEIPANQTDYTNKTFFSQNMQSTNSNNSSARQDFIRFGSSLSESLFAAWDNSLFFSSDALVNVAEEPDNPLRHKPLTQVPATLGTEELFYTKPQSENSPVYRQTAQAVKECQDLAASKSPIHIHLRLEPPELGHVIIHVRMLGNSLEAHFRAEHLSTHTLLEQQRSLLQEHLTELGINVKTIVVSYDPEQQRRWRSWFEAPIMKTKPLTRVANELASSSEDVIVNMTA
ncbi:MAG: flagellar hook-length control protein FliK [Gemmatales bacterium]|nr:flagellar hook-length control protein FliK [Gemmatales bacterium]MDW7993694.1 flagellar hook-length control protein FliK [Gemmatales bacterium]